MNLSSLNKGFDRGNREKIAERVPDSDYQARHHFIPHSPWDQRLLCQDIAGLENALLGGNNDVCLLMDITAIPKKDTASVGDRKYCVSRAMTD